MAKRPMTPGERAQLADVLNRGRGWRRAVENALVMWAVFTLGFTLLWGLLGRWVGPPVFGVYFGWYSPFALWIAVAGIAICAVMAIVSTYRWITSGSARTAGLTADLRDGVVSESSYRIVEAKCFQEDEHHGLLYFLRTDGDRVFVLYDSESQDLAMAEKDPFTSSMKPRTQLRVVRAPTSRYVLSTTLEGDELARGNPVAMHAPPDEWPEDSEFCKVPWDQLERRFGPPAA